ncbi:expressed unknown protein [Seminavis robusta]|uniref:Uncharacterized protein n=1 Tax=Seminavis robusta TaxID=568900 RepID=A0A9N8DDD9_9STRA|nr:expressed unknown protein [Seminavis robusta]|eukprot:Sro43_g025880.1 n/a (163) ;mRNA; r:5585-6073
MDTFMTAPMDLCASSPVKGPSFRTSFSVASKLITQNRFLPAMLSAVAQAQDLKKPQAQLVKSTLTKKRGHTSLSDRDMIHQLEAKHRAEMTKRRDPWNKSCGTTPRRAIPPCIRSSCAPPKLAALAKMKRQGKQTLSSTKLYGCVRDTHGALCSFPRQGAVI